MDLKEGKKRFSCTFCFYTTDFKSSLQNHEMLHTGEKPYKCNFCEKQFINRQRLKRHEQLHTGEKKSYKCKVCDKAFAVRSTLKIHESAHTVERPYNCKVCNKSFALNIYLKNHKKNVHYSSTPFKCKCCGRCFFSDIFLQLHVKENHSNSDIDQSCTNDDKVTIDEENVREDIDFVNHEIEDSHATIDDVETFEIKENNTEDPPLVTETKESCQFVEYEESNIQEIEEEVEIDETDDPLSFKVNELSCDVCQQVFSQRVVLFMHKDLNH